MLYRGRFAPSPSGPLHFGSLVCALASYLDAKQHNGEWLVRMEDIDPPREEPEAQTKILCSLQAHGLFWDGDVLFQSQRSHAYQSTLKTLKNKNLTYSCTCTRKKLASLKGIYDRHCLEHPTNTQQHAAIRLKTIQSLTNVSDLIQFNDLIKGLQSENIQKVCGDFSIHRKDGLFAYQLAVVIDDIEQGITHIVRGDDLLSSTSRQIYLTKTLGGSPPSYAHIPVILGHDGCKLSKQTHAPAINNDDAISNVIRALHALKVTIPSTLRHKPLNDILKFGCEHYQLTKLA